MADREERREQAAKHNALMVGALSSETEATIAAATIYEEGEGRTLELPEPTVSETETIVTTSFAPEALSRYGCGKTVLVDPASFTRPGGAYVDGAFGPEQILCDASNLYQVLCGIKGFYHAENRNYRRGSLFTDRAAYLPDVAFLCNGGVRKADVIVVAEPLRTRALENHRSERECDHMIEERIETILRIAAANECETLIIGAFGCGRNGYDTDQVIGLFDTWINEHPGALSRIVFAVPRAYFGAFNTAFGKPVEEKVVTYVKVEEEDDEFDWRNVKLPEGVTLR